MRNIWVDKATEADGAPAAAAFLRTEQNLLDADALLYPASVTYKASRNGEPVMYLPVQRVRMLESLGIAEGASESDVALSLRELIQVVRWEAKKDGEGELYFGCKEPRTIKFAEAHGFEEVPFKVYRMKLK